jgi:hypothetical protein
MFNSRQYEWADLTCIAGGRDLTAIRGVKYSEKIEREAIYAKGRNPHSIQSGNIMIEGELTMLQSELLALETSGGGSILSLSIDVIVNYGTIGSVLRTDRLEGVRFTEAPKELKQGDKFMEVTIPFVCLNLVNNI